MTACLFILAITLIVQKTFILKSASFSDRPRTSVCVGNVQDNYELIFEAQSIFYLKVFTDIFKVHKFYKNK